MKAALILSGCGQHDGSETQEVVLTLLSLAQEGVEWDAFAPDIPQDHVTNHLTETLILDERRNALLESARLVRGKVQAIEMCHVSDYDFFIIPGGLGVVSTLCNWSEKGKDFTINSDIEKLLAEAIKLHKPVGFICIAPIMMTKLFSDSRLTLGNDPELAKQVNELGAIHINSSATEIVIDEGNKAISTPANMVANDITEVYEGIDKLVKGLARMIEK